MAEKCFPLGNTLYDESDAQLWLAPRTTGVYASGHLGVTADSGMNILVGSGVAWLHLSDFAGLVYANTLALSKTITTADANYDRWDRIVVRYDIVANATYLAVRKGTAASTPAYPAIVRDASMYEISLARVFVGRGVTAISGANIYDERMDATVCGLMTDGVTHLDTSVFQTQIAAFIEEQTAEFLDWMTQLGEILDENAAGNLLNLINQLQTDLDALEGVVSGHAPVAFSVTVPASGWSASAPYTQTVTVTGVLATDTPLVDISLSATAATAILQLASFAYVGKIVTAANQITLTCYEDKPTVDLPLRLRVVR